MMNKENRDKTLLEVIRQGLFLASTHNSKLALGDRDKYIGASEIAQYAECPRAAVAARFMESGDSIGNLLTLERGHWFENGIRTALKAANLRHFHQLEINARRKRGAIRAHLDFTLAWEKPMLAVRILEVKSTSNLPGEPYPSHILQAQAQVDILHRNWNRPVFSLRNEEGEILHENLTFPEICKKQLGLELPEHIRKVSLESWLLYLSMRDARAFGPYSASRDSLGHTIGLADEFWGAIRGVQNGNIQINDIPHARGFYPLCSWCAANRDCPKFAQGDFQPQWEEAIQKLEELKESREEAQAQISEIENALKQAHRLSGTREWIDTGKHRFRMSTVAGRKSLNQDALKTEIADILHGMGSDLDVESLFAGCMKQGASYPRLIISTIN